MPITAPRASHPTTSGVVSILAASLAFSWGFVLVKALGLPVATIAGWRLLIGAAALTLAIALLRPRERGPFLPVLGAGVCFGLHQLAFIAATHRTSIAVVTLVGALQPLLLGLTSRASGPRRAPLYLWSLLAAAGVALVVLGKHDERSRSLFGDGLAVVNLGLYSAYYLFSKRARETGWATLLLTRNTFAISLAVVAPAWFLAPSLSPPGAREWGALFVLALVPGNGHLLVNWALPRVSAALGSIVLTAVPLLASLWAHLIFDEPYGPRHWVGMGLVALAIEGARRVEAS